MLEAPAAVTAVADTPSLAGWICSRGIGGGGAGAGTGWRTLCAPKNVYCRFIRRSISLRQGHRPLATRKPGSGRLSWRRVENGLIKSEACASAEQVARRRRSCSLRISISCWYPNAGFTANLYCFRDIHVIQAILLHRSVIEPRDNRMFSILSRRSCKTRLCIDMSYGCTLL